MVWKIKNLAPAKISGADKLMITAAYMGGNDVELLVHQAVIDDTHDALLALVTEMRARAQSIAAETQKASITSAALENMLNALPGSMTMDEALAGAAAPLTPPPAPGPEPKPAPPAPEPAPMPADAAVIPL